MTARPDAGPAGEHEQLALAAMPKRLFACTPSRLAAYDCPRRYRMTYLDRPTPQRGGPWAHTTLGAVTHVALHRWWQLPRAERTPPNGALAVARNWRSDGFRDEDQSAVWRARAEEWVTRYLTGVDPAAEPVGVERVVATRTRRLALSGRVDRIDERGGELVIVDYKTGRHPPGDDDARTSPALACYALATQRTLRRACRRVELHHLPSGTVAAHEHTDESLARQIGRAEATADDIVAASDALDAGADRDEAFPARPSSLCAWCDFRRHCAPGQAAAPAVETWAGLPDR
ncbi:MAG: PD-(D/E)XK nuclease family protein [Actinomycetia bacterium]|nr:PD-(D/E)XK nuclease family protein [Actinomycetes bacterium]